MFLLWWNCHIQCERYWLQFSWTALYPFTGWQQQKRKWDCCDQSLVCWLITRLRSVGCEMILPCCLPAGMFLPRPLTSHHTSAPVGMTSWGMAVAAYSSGNQVNPLMKCFRKLSSGSSKFTVSVRASYIIRSLCFLQVFFKVYTRAKDMMVIAGSGNNQQT